MFIFCTSWLSLKNKNVSGSLKYVRASLKHQFVILCSTVIGKVPNDSSEGFYLDFYGFETKEQKRIE